jgi:DNA-binding transcriptional ArsR family regulator
MPRPNAGNRAAGPPSGGAPGVVSDARGAATLLDPTRTRLLSELREPGSGASLARKLGLPRQRLNYHLRELEKQGLVELVEERRRGNCMERVVRATARTYLIDPALLGALGPEPEAVRDRASVGFQIAVAARSIRELAEIAALARDAGQRVATLTLDTEIRFASATARNAFAEELTAAVGRLVAKYNDTKAAGGRRFRLVAAVHPKRRREGGDA